MNTNHFCSCQPSVSAVRELCPACLAEWHAWQEENLRQAAAFAAYGDPYAAAPAAGQAVAA